MAGPGAIATVCGLLLGVLFFVGKSWIENRNQALEYQPRNTKPPTSNRAPNSTVQRGKCEFCDQQGATIRACKHAFHDSCYALCGNKCPTCTTDPEKKPL